MNNLKDIHILKLFLFIFYMSMGIIVTYLPLYFEAVGYSKVQIGTLLGIGPIAGIVSNILWGVISDRFQTVKKVLIILLFGQMIMLLWLWQVDQFSITLIVILFFFFFQNPVISLSDSLTLLTIKNTKSSYAGVRVWGSLGFSFSALVMGFILNRVGMDKTIFLLFITTAAAFFLTFGLRDRQGSVKKMEFSGIFNLLRSKELLWFLLLIFVISISHRTNDHFISLYLKELGTEEKWLGLSPMVAALSEIPVLLLLSKYGHRYKELPLLAVAGLAYTLRYVLTAALDNPYLIIGVQALHSISFGIFLITAIRYLSGLIPDEYRSTGLAVFTVIWAGLAGMSSGMLGGWLYNQFNGETLYYIAALLGFISSIGFFGTHLYKMRTKS
ncbi:MFS transporter [Chengkuizengella axinellae]|uniref:MFS transporter n=1 Tax=Chengkuizengella axinellae TaxID=3064388 RepID=A0ABT9J292_9BACL|nr:MFS transporter [Chengkuizengella sp. 2205SS18-9]MDP5275712.1 MFS transporter [Chengkuizengella sp. 2205SS18-9]